MIRTAIIVGFGLLVPVAVLAADGPEGASKPVGPWTVQATMIRDKFHNCSMQRTDNRMETLFVHRADGYFLILSSPGWKLDPAVSYPVRLAGGSLDREAQAEAVSAQTVRIWFNDDEDLIEAMKKAPTLELRAAGGTIRIPFDQGAAALAELQTCWREHTQTAAADTNPFAAQPQGAAKPSAPAGERPPRPELADLGIAKAVCDAYSTNYDQTIAGCSAVISHNEAPAETRAAAFFNRGQAYKAKDDDDKALADYGEAIRLNPSDPNFYFYRAMVYSIKRGDPDRSIADLDQAIRLDPRYPYFSSRGDDYRKKHDLNRALADYSEAIRLDPKNTILLITRGNTYMDKGDYKQALADFETALQLAPNNQYTIEYAGKGRDAARAKLATTAPASSPQRRLPSRPQ